MNKAARLIEHDRVEPWRLIRLVTEKIVFSVVDFHAAPTNTKTSKPQLDTKQRAFDPSPRREVGASKGGFPAGASRLARSEWFTWQGVHPCTCERTRLSVAPGCVTSAWCGGTGLAPATPPWTSVSSDRLSRLVEDAHVRVAEDALDVLVHRRTRARRSASSPRARTHRGPAGGGIAARRGSTRQRSDGHLFGPAQARVAARRVHTRGRKWAPRNGPVGVRSVRLVEATDPGPRQRSGR